MWCAICRNLASGSDATSRTSYPQRGEDILLVQSDILTFGEITSSSSTSSSSSSTSSPSSSSPSLSSLGWDQCTNVSHEIGFPGRRQDFDALQLFQHSLHVSLVMLVVMSIGIAWFSMVLAEAAVMAIVVMVMVVMVTVVMVVMEIIVVLFKLLLIHTGSRKLYVYTHIMRLSPPSEIFAVPPNRPPTTPSLTLAHICMGMKALGLHEPNKIA
jgi:hypothetical protein